MLERSERVIPLGSQTFSKSRVQMPAGRGPMFLSHGRDGRVWDVDGNEYVDLVCGLLPVVLGYRDPDVDRAIREQLDRGISFSLATELEIEVAERLAEIIPCAEMVRFGKNGSDATSGAVRLARAVTGRDRLAAGGYHGWHDWYIGATTRNLGVPGAVSELTHRFAYGDIEALHKLFRQHPGEFAAVIMEPMSSAEPPKGYLQEAAELTRKNGALFILDEIITGFRFSLGGAQELLRVTPDLACFGKSMANGMPVSALVGKAEYMRLLEKLFFSFTFGGEALSLAASKAVIDKMRSEPVIETLWRTGGQFSDMARRTVERHGLAEVMRLNGLPPWRIWEFSPGGNADEHEIKTFFMIGMMNEGVLINASHNVCFAHGPEDVKLVAAAYDKVLGELAAALKAEDLKDKLGGPAVRPVFSVR
jgi:glutamate-1-semialdehyde 2,1-aminomutase/spore coat polysaccharide biosynthesis protein SpsF